MAASSKDGRAASMSPEEIDRHRRESAEVSRRLCEASAKAVQALARDHLAAAGAVLDGDSPANRVARLRLLRKGLSSEMQTSAGASAARDPGDWDVPTETLEEVRLFRADFRAVVSAWVRDGWHSREEVIAWRDVIKSDMQNAISANFAIDPRPQLERIRAWCGTFRRLAVELDKG